MNLIQTLIVQLEVVDLELQGVDAPDLDSRVAVVEVLLYLMLMLVVEEMILVGEVVDEG